LTSKPPTPPRVKTQQDQLQVRQTIPTGNGDAWLSMLDGLSSMEAHSGAQSIAYGAFAVNTNGLLHLGQWPGAERVLTQADDTWVGMYERRLADLAKQARRRGERQAGVFYTPAPVARYLVERSLGCYLEAQLVQVRLCPVAEQNDLITTIVKNVEALQILDPACGTGIFLLEALRCLTAFYHQLAVLVATLQEGKESLPLEREQVAAMLESQWVFHAMTRQLSGVDIDPLAVAIAQARVFQWGWQALCALGTRAIDDKVAFSAIDTAAFSARWACRNAIADASITLQSHSDDFQAARWDFILGNPPYVSQVRGQAERFQALLQLPGAATGASYHHPKMDLCDAFLAWSADNLKPGGQLAFVLPEYWSQRAAAAPIRKRLWMQGAICELRIFPDTPLFPEAPGHHSALLVWQRAINPNIADVASFDAKPEPTRHYLGHFAAVGDADHLCAEDLQSAAFYQHPVNDRLFYGSPPIIALLERLSGYPVLLKPDEICQGIILPQGRVHPDGRRTRGRHAKGRQSIHVEQQATEQGVFLLTEAEVVALDLNADEARLLKPYYAPHGFFAFSGFARENRQSASYSKADYQLVYGDAKARRLIYRDPDRYARLMAHLDRFAALNTSAFAPYGLHRPRQTMWFEDTSSENATSNNPPVRILGLRQTMQPCFAIVDEAAYVNEAFYILRPAENPAYVTALLNCELAHFWFYHQKRKGHQLQVDKDVLSYFPAPPNSASNDCENRLNRLAKQLAALSDQSSKQAPEATALHQHLLRELNATVYAAYGFTRQEVNLIVTWQASLTELLRKR
jgi:hypothetical protein